MSEKWKPYIKRIANLAKEGDELNLKRIKTLTKLYLKDLSIQYTPEELIDNILNDKINVKEICYLFKSNQTYDLLELFLPKGAEYSINSKKETLLLLNEPYLWRLEPDLDDKFWENIDQIYDEYIERLNKNISDKYDFNFKIGYTDNGIENDIKFLFSAIGIIIDEKTDVFCVFNNLEQIRKDFYNEEYHFFKELNKKYLH